MRSTFDWYNRSLYFVAYYLLLEDCLQKKTFASLRNLVYRGELLHVSKTEEWYVHDTNPRLFVNCSRDQVKHVHYVYPQFLLAITDLNSRYDLFINKLELLSSIALHTIGNEVEVRKVGKWRYSSCSYYQIYRTTSSKSWHLFWSWNFGKATCMYKLTITAVNQDIFNVLT